MVETTESRDADVERIAAALREHVGNTRAVYAEQDAEALYDAGLRSTSRDSEVREAIEALRSLSDAATVGPWQWDGQVGQYVNLATVGHGVLTVMGTKRLGMNGSEPVFYRRDPGEVWGWNGKAEPASKVAVREVPYRDDIADIDNPNAQLIVAAVNAVRTVLAILDRSSEEAHRG